MQMAENEDTLTISQAARLIGVERTAIWAAIKAGRLVATEPTSRTGPRYITLADLRIAYPELTRIKSGRPRLTSEEFHGLFGADIVHISNPEEVATARERLREMDAELDAPASLHGDGERNLPRHAPASPTPRGDT